MISICRKGYSSHNGKYPFLFLISMQSKWSLCSPTLLHLLDQPSIANRFQNPNMYRISAHFYYTIRAESTELVHSQGVPDSNWDLTMPLQSIEDVLNHPQMA